MAIKDNINKKINIFLTFFIIQPQFTKIITYNKNKNKFTKYKKNIIKRKKTKGINIPKTISAPKLYTSAKSLHQIKNGSKIMKARENNVLTRKCFFMSLPPRICKVNAVLNPLRIIFICGSNVFVHPLG